MIIAHPSYMLIYFKEYSLNIKNCVTILDYFSQTKTVTQISHLKTTNCFQSNLY